MADITPLELKNKFENKDSFLFFDVREEWEYEEANIGATLFPLNDIPLRFNEMIPDKASEIVVHCQTGKRSNQARIYLESKGFSNVYSLAGGIVAYWELRQE